MATIYRLEASGGRRGSSAGSVGKPPSAEIILFPGVRYERWSDAENETAAQHRGRRQRDRLEIAE